MNKKAYYDLVKQILRDKSVSLIRDRKDFNKFLDNFSNDYIQNSNSKVEKLFLKSIKNFIKLKRGILDKDMLLKGKYSKPSSYSPLGLGITETKSSINPNDFIKNYKKYFDINTIWIPVKESKHSKKVTEEFKPVFDLLHEYGHHLDHEKRWAGIKPELGEIDIKEVRGYLKEVEANREAIKLIKETYGIKDPDKAKKLVGEFKQYMKPATNTYRKEYFKNYVKFNLSERGVADFIEKSKGLNKLQKLKLAKDYWHKYKKTYNDIMTSKELTADKIKMIRNFYKDLPAFKDTW